MAVRTSMVPYNKAVPGRKGSLTTLVMECEDEELTVWQKKAYQKAEQDYAEVLSKLEKLKQQAELIQQRNDVVAYSINATPAVNQVVPMANSLTPVANRTNAVQGPKSVIAKHTPGSIVVTPTINATTSPATTPVQLVVNSQILMNANMATGATRPSPVATSAPNVTAATRLATPTPTPGSIRVRIPGPAIKPIQPKTVQVSAGAGSGDATKKVVATVDLTDTGEETPSASSNVPAPPATTNKPGGKTFPSLVVIARPSLRLKDFPQSVVSQERKNLDQKVKSVLIFSPTKFTEWLIQQGLVRSEQFCPSHVNSDFTPIRLKLGMYSDVTKFPYSGGYVWISDCCPQRFVSVFSGSIFEGAPHPPTVLLKLMYHWACQTNVQNVVQWVKVDNFYIKNFFTNMRSICTSALHEKHEKLGGNRRCVEVGVISLGTTSQDGNMRQVKVEVLGAMDTQNKLVRLRAIEPPTDGERNYRKRFLKILEPLNDWVQKDSVIITDYTVDKGTLHTLGFTSVYQVSMNSNVTDKDHTNHNIMEYLRRVVPRMFQNTLSLLSRQIIQQFLDELVWRERWGTHSAAAFDNIVCHLAEQTKFETGESLLIRLGKIACDPFRLWTYSSGREAETASAASDKGAVAETANANVSPAIVPSPPSTEILSQNAKQVDVLGRGGRPRKRMANDDPNYVPEVYVPPPPAKKPALEQQMVALDAYYYGTYKGEKTADKPDPKNTMSVKCCVCKKPFTNNILLMKHLIAHANDNMSMELSDLTQCKYCLKDFDTPFSMQSHVETTHLIANNNLVCRICEEQFKDRITLINHMNRNHVAQEMPYTCDICTFRASMHRVAIDHFYEMHGGGDRLQCPFCLKSVVFCSQSKKLGANIFFFFDHIRKHQRKSIARKCSRCCLWFIHKGFLKEHQQKDHNSFKGIRGVSPFKIPEDFEPITMPAPQDRVRAPLRNRGSGSLSRSQQVAFTTRTFEKLSIQEVGMGQEVCCECEDFLASPEHFPGYMCCTRCRYATCCKKAMNEHTIVFHEGKKPEFSMGKAIQLEKNMYCVCGYKTTSGNRLARHLSVCERKSAYPSTERAKAATFQSQSATFPPLVTLDDNPDAEDPSDQWLKAFVARRGDEEGKDSERRQSSQATQGNGRDPPSMLNILGLVRRSSNDESSQDKPTDHDDDGEPARKRREAASNKTEEKEADSEMLEVEVESVESKHSEEEKESKEVKESEERESKDEEQEKLDEMETEDSREESSRKEDNDVAVEEKSESMEETTTEAKNADVETMESDDKENEDQVDTGDEEELLRDRGESDDVPSAGAADKKDDGEIDSREEDKMLADETSEEQAAVESVNENGVEMPDADLEEEERQEPAGEKPEEREKDVAEASPDDVNAVEKSNPEELPAEES